MARYIILTTFESGSESDPADLIDRADEVARRIENDCPDIDWIESYATMGRFDVVDVVESDDPAQIEQAAMIIRTYGRGRTETLTAVAWDELLGRLR